MGSVRELDNPNVDLDIR